MIDALFNQTNYVASKAMLDTTVLRHQAIASNIANVETPGYKRMEISRTFENELASAIASGDQESISRMTPSLAVDTTAVATKRDGNTVNLEKELIAMNENFLEHTLETKLVTGSLLRMRMAITGKS